MEITLKRTIARVVSVEEVEVKDLGGTRVGLLGEGDAYGEDRKFLDERNVISTLTWSLQRP